MKYLYQGFTLIELMVVIAILAVLAAIAIPTYVDYIARSQMTEAFSIATGLKSPVIEYYTTYGVCPENGKNSTNKGGFGDMSSYSGHYVEAARVGLDVENYCSIWVKMRTKNLSSGIAGKILNLELRKDSTPGAFVWGCLSNADQRYLPPACQGNKSLSGAAAGFN